MRNIDELKSLVCARYDLMYVVTHEEERVVSDLRAISEQLNMSVCVWTFSSGSTIYEPKPDTKAKKAQQQDPTLGNPVNILDMVLNAKADTIFILKDYHPYLKDAEIMRKVKDVVAVMKPSYTPIVMVSPTLKVPIELEKQTTVMEYTLPTRVEIAELVDAMVNSIKDRESDFDFSEEMKEATIRACQGLTLREVENIISRSIVEKGTIDPSAVMHEKKQIIKKSGILEYYEANSKMEEVGGMSNLKNWLQKRKSSFTEEARKFGLPFPKGLLLPGVPGCGKSEICKAVASFWNMPLLKFDVGAVMQGVVGSSEENMRKVIQVAEASAPVILWIDEIEKGLSGTGSSNFSDAGTLSRVFATFITWLNEKQTEVFVIATANDVTQLPPELMRKGRFDEMFFVDLPEVEERRDIFRIHLSKVNRDPSRFDLDKLAEVSDGFSGADIRQCIIEAMYNVFENDRGMGDIRDEHILKAVRETTPLSKTMGPQITKIREWGAANRARPASLRSGK